MGGERERKLKKIEVQSIWRRSSITRHILLQPFNFYLKFQFFLFFSKPIMYKFENTRKKNKQTKHIVPLPKSICTGAVTPDSKIYC
jgi:hypothetical protein